MERPGNVLKERDLVPFETSTLSGERVLVFAPHPDDETLGCGGTLIQHVRRGEMVRVVFLTDGNGGDFLGLYDPQQYIDLREEEACKACAVLGIRDFEFLRFPDRRLGSEIAHLDRVRREIIEFEPALVYVTSPLEINPDHRSAAALVWQVIAESKRNIQLSFYEVSTPLQPNILVDITQQEQQKRLAASCYSSQMNPINYTDLALSVNRFRSLTVAATCEYVEGYFVLNSLQIMGRRLKDFFTLRKMEKVASEKVGPLVSIVVRTKDRPKLLQDALVSLQNQTYKNLEVIVVNDGGIDIRDVLLLFENYLKIEYLFLQKCQGRSNAANAGLRQAKGRLIGFLDDDDILYPDHLFSLVQFMTGDTPLDFAYSDCAIARYTEENGSGHLIRGELEPFKGYDFDREKLYQMNYIPIMTALFSKDLLEKAGMLDESLDVFEDWDLWIRMSMHCDFKRLPEITCEYRIIGARSYDYLAGQIKIYKKYWQIYTPEKVIAWLHQAQGENDILRDELQAIKKVRPNTQ